MNYVWYPLIRAMQLGYDTTKIQYRVKSKIADFKIDKDLLRFDILPHRVSPLMEYMPVVLFDPDEAVKPEHKFAHADINPYYRFEDIFDYILSPKRNCRYDCFPPGKPANPPQCEECKMPKHSCRRCRGKCPDCMRPALKCKDCPNYKDGTRKCACSIHRNDTNDLIVCDIIAHMLAHIDRHCGMNKKDFHIMLLLREMENGCYGDADIFIKLFDVVEKRALVEAMLMFYETQNGFRTLDTLLTRIMTDFSVVLRDNAEAVLYNSYGYDAVADKKIRFIVKLLLPIGLPYIIHWQNTYGTLDHEESMKMGEFVL